MQAGDYVSMNGEDGTIWYGEVVGTKDDTIEVYFIEKGDAGIWSYSEEWHAVPKECVVSHVEVSDHSNVIGALNELGFRPLTDSTFARLNDTADLPLGDAAFDAIEEDEIVGVHPEMKDFIVPDEEGERFTFATPDNAFVRETHDAVRRFNGWNPAGEARRVKNFILGMEERSIEQENARTRLGESMSYNNPPE